jgi:hypothetical protein
LLGHVIVGASLVIRNAIPADIPITKNKIAKVCIGVVLILFSMILKKKL